MDQPRAPVAPSDFHRSLGAVEALKWAVAVCALVMIMVAWAATLAVLLWWAA
jgi:hypothetical protein